MMRDPVRNPAQNRLLAALPQIERERMYPELEFGPDAAWRRPVRVRQQAGQRYFPATAIISLLYVMGDGASAEIAVVGNDGMVGVALFMGGETTPSRAVVQSAGAAYRLPGRVLKEDSVSAGRCSNCCCATRKRS